jgi:hypothetical protein
MSTSNVTNFTHPHTTRLAETPFDIINASPAGSKLFFPVGERQLGWQRRDGTYEPLNTHKSIIRLSLDGKSAHTINVVSRTYKLVHNRELFTAIEDAMCTEIGDAGIKGVVVKDSIVHSGKTCVREYHFPNVICDRPRDTRARSIKSDIGFRIIARNSYGGSAIRLYSGAIEFYCTNGMLTGEHDVAYFRHSSGLQLASIGVAVRKSLDAFVSAQSKWQHWAATRVSHSAAMDFFRAVAQTPRMLDVLQTQWLMESEDRDQTVYGVYSALTNYASHENSGGFTPQRRLNEDTRAMTMLGREVQVQKWTETPHFARLLVETL